MRWVRTMVIAASLAGLAACGGPSETATDAGDPARSQFAADTAGPPAAFGQCISCHSMKPGLNGVGPSLHGIVGAKAASVPGYAYSGPLRNSGLTWDEATLDKWLAAPMKMVPGTKMVFPGMPDPARRKAVIDYLAAAK